MSISKNFKNRCLSPPKRAIGSCRPSKKRQGPFYNKNIYIKISKNLFIIKIYSGRPVARQLGDGPVARQLGDWGRPLFAAPAPGGRKESWASKYLGQQLRMFPVGPIVLVLNCVLTQPKTNVLPEIF